MDEFVDRAVSWVKQHKAFTVLLVAVLAVVGSFFLSAGFGTTYMRSTTGEVSSFDGGISGQYAREFQHAEDAIQQTDFQVKTGNVQVESVDAEGDAAKLREKVRGLNGKVESERKSETDTQIRVYVQVRVPVEQFEGFADWTRSTYTVEDASFGFETVSVEQQQNQVNVLLEALNIYNNLLRKLNQTDAEKLSAEQIEAIATITDRKLWVAQQLERYGYSISQVEEQAAMSTVSFTFREDKPIKYAPEDLGRRFKQGVQDMVRDITNVGISVVTDSLVVLAKTVQWIIYALIVLIPVYLVYKAVRKLYGKVERGDR